MGRRRRVGLGGAGWRLAVVTARDARAAQRKAAKEAERLRLEQEQRDKELAREAELEPCEVRLRNLVRPEQMPFENVVKKEFDGGDYPECLRRAMAAIDTIIVRMAPRRRLTLASRESRGGGGIESGSYATGRACGSSRMVATDSLGR